MSDPLHVEQRSLHASADRVDGLRAEHVDVHKAANARIADAGSGLVGQAAAALGAKMPDWQGRSRYIENELTHFRDAFDKTGYGFAATDEDSKINFFRIRSYTGAVNPSGW